MNTYNDLCNKILNEYQIEQTPNQPKNPIIDNLMNYLGNIKGVDPKSIDRTAVEEILKNKQPQEQEEVDNVENTQQPVQNIPNNSVKPNIVSNIPNNLTPVQNKNIQKNNIVR
jgi:hypothetical protein